MDVNVYRGSAVWTRAGLWDLKTRFGGHSWLKHVGHEANFSGQPWRAWRKAGVVCSSKLDAA